METGIIVELVNNVGFPIAVSVALFYQNFKVQETHNKTFSEFKEVIKHNTQSLEQLSKVIHDIERGDR